VTVHILSPEKRDYYALEELWGDASEVTLKEDQPPIEREPKKKKAPAKPKAAKPAKKAPARKAAKKAAKKAVKRKK